MKYAIPSPQAKGFLRRLRSAQQIALKKTDPDENTIDAMCDYLLPFIVEPEDRDEARTALLDASKEEYEELMRFVNGGGAENPTAPGESGTS